jgi:hypothetical protein
LEIRFVILEMNQEEEPDTASSLRAHIHVQNTSREDSLRTTTERFRNDSNLIT